ncbi:mucin-3A-like [Harmonia axyridis]|uniref:mucin-3A-like n=1 Tax=Harmonia axyridis TaxID=115357 RepID=UPI001E275284|nr:mucin-3A-like [Harmonia axyridis]
MLMPKEFLRTLAIFLVLTEGLTGLDQINSSPRRLQQNREDVTTVLLVDNNGRSPYGRFLNVKPDVGLITSTARTFVQEGVTTEYATQVVGTTLDDGRLYAHLLTKTSRVIYDGDGKPHELNTKKISIDQNRFGSDHFVKNTDYIFPHNVEVHSIFATTQPSQHQDIREDASEAETLKESPSNDVRISSPQNNNNNHKVVYPEKIQVFKVNSQNKDERENLIFHREDENSLGYNPSKVKQWGNLPTFTVRNEFSPSGFSYLGDLPEYDLKPERNKQRPPNDRRAKNLFLAGLLKPSPKELKTTTYTGFADFTTTVGDTVIVFTPHTSQIPKVNSKSVTKVTVEPTIKPTATFVRPVFEAKSVTPLTEVTTTVQPILETTTSRETDKIKNEQPTPEIKSDLAFTELTTSPSSTESSTPEDVSTTETDEESGNHISSMIVDKNNRQKYGKSQNIDEYLDMEAKSAVLAREQQSDTSETTLPNSEVIEPSESQTLMLSTPSHEDIAKIFASLRAQESKATEPLNTAATIFFDSKEDLEEEKPSGGATTIFFNDDLPIQNTASEVTTSSATEIVTLPETTTKQTSETTTENQEIISERPLTSADDQTTSTIEEIPTTENENVSDEENLILDDKKTTDDETVECTEGIKIIPSTIYKTLTYLTTFFIPDGESTSTSIRSNEVITSDVKKETASCSASQVAATKVLSENIEPSASVTTTEQEIETTDPITTEHIETTEPVTTVEEEPELQTTTEELQSTPQEITTERRHVTESEPITTEETTEEGEEIELIFKTLYTTYTYLTTYFQDTTSSVASRIVVTTNVVTSTLDPAGQSSEDAVSGLFASLSDVDNSYKSRQASFEDFEEISPSQLEPNLPSTTNDQKENTEATPSLDGDDLGVKTYYTTYTYFTTIFVDDETEVSSRTEVYTNYVTPSIKPTKTRSVSIPTLTFDDEEEEDDENEDSYEEKYDTTIIRNNTATTAPEETTEIQNVQQTLKNGYVTLRRTTTEDAPIEDNLLHPINESISTMVKSTTSNGERRLLNNVDKRNILDDQIVSESNNESEIIPSPTLLLQTSYTTFTYFTTMYHGTTGSNVVSRLETVTNIVTETLTPSHTLSLDDLSLPITYFTTFTYWTTLYKQGTTKVTSREETISNVVTPTLSAENSESKTIEFTPTVEIAPTSSSVAPIEPTTVDDDLLTTVYTTYTYYTTSYVGGETVINSRLETVTSTLNKSENIESNQITNTSEVVTPSEVKTETIESSSPSLKPTGLLSTIVNTEENSGTTTIFSTDVFGTYIDGLYAKILESTSSILTETVSSTPVVENLKPTGVVSINKGQIVDADGISTLFYTTQAVGTYIDNLYAQVIESTSSLEVDEEKKQLQTEIPVAKRTGLVRLIKGSIVQNSTTTLYQSKVIGTIIDGRYAQVIESTSSFLKDNFSPSSTTTEAISPTSTLPPGEEIKPTSITISPSSAVIEGSLSETLKPEDDVKEEDSSENTKSKPSFQPKKKTFTPGIRPFVQRPKSSYTPKRRLPGATSATTVTRNDFTPTVTAIPASRGKFGNRRNSASINPTASNSRKFSRSKTSSFGGRRSSSRIQPSSTGFGSSSRRGFRSSSPGAILRSSGLPGNSARFRIRPTATSPLFKSSIYPGNADSADNDSENSVTTQISDDENNENETTLQASTTTESNKRQNPLLKLLRTPLSRPPITKGRPSGANNGRANSIGRNNKRTTTTTFKPKTTRSSAFRGRPNALFPRRNLFTTTTTTTEPPEEEEEEGEEEDVGDDETLLEEGEEEDDNDYEGSQKRSVIAKPPISSASGVKIRPFKFGKRAKRDTYSRFRRPTPKSTTAAPEEDYPEYEAPKPKPKNNRFTPRSRKLKTTASTTQTPTTASRKGISPNKVKPQSRTQFTLRPEKEKSSFRRPSSQRSRTTTSSPRPRPKSSYNSYQNEQTNNRKNAGRSNSRNSNNRRTTSRSRVQQQDLNDNNVLPAFDGTITVTHQIPTEITIPILNGKITEYKNIITAKLSTEILGPSQYSTTVNPLGREVTVLLSESTNLANNGATLVTHFVLNETPTTSVTFTPTYIRNRKTSFSHIVPSTIYAVEQVVNTIQPALAAQAPLANILLSQLLLGGLQPQNPLIGLQNPGVAPTPTTEFKTRTTTYVTTVTSSSSTVIPLTFRGKEILTTIIDSSVNVITATEFLTDTIVVTPTVGFPVASPQLNTLLLPLLQQQLAQPPAPQFVPKNANLELFQEATLNEPDEFNLALEAEEVEEDPIIETRPKSKKSAKKPKKIAPVDPPKETSVITLYVSGKTPGEFSTVLSTIIQDPRDRQKRESGEEIRPSRLIHDLLISTQDYLDTYVLPGRKELSNINPEANSETESLESILGDVSKHLINTSRSKSTIKPTKINYSTESQLENIHSSDQNILNNFLA